MKTVIIYKSKYGYTKKYAHWISEKMNADIYEVSEADKLGFSVYDTVIYGGGLYAGGINGIGYVKGVFDKISSKNIIVFTVGLADPNVQSNVDGITAHIDKDFSPAMRQKIKAFHLRGGIDYQKLGIIHKSMMLMLKKSVEKKPDEKLSQEDVEMLETYGEQVDFTAIDTLGPMLEYIKSLETQMRS